MVSIPSESYHWSGHGPTGLLKSSYGLITHMALFRSDSEITLCILARGVLCDPGNVHNVISSHQLGSGELGPIKSACFTCLIKIFFIQDFRLILAITSRASFNGVSPVPTLGEKKGISIFVHLTCLFFYFSFDY